MLNNFYAQKTFLKTLSLNILFWAFYITMRSAQIGLILLHAFVRLLNQVLSIILSPIYVICTIWTLSVDIFAHHLESFSEHLLDFGKVLAGEIINILLIFYPIIDVILVTIIKCADVSLSLLDKAHQCITHQPPFYPQSDHLYHLYDRKKKSFNSTLQTLAEKGIKLIWGYEFFFHLEDAIESSRNAAYEESLYIPDIDDIFGSLEHDLEESFKSGEQDLIQHYPEPLPKWIGHDSLPKVAVVA